MARFFSVCTFLATFMQCTCFAQVSDSRNDFIVTSQFLSVKDGLASREVYCVAQDLNGFIWFGTKFGLNRFDGKNIKLFTTQDGLSSNVISNLFVDNENRLIIQYGLRWTPHNSSGFADVFDLNTFSVSPYKKFTATSQQKENKPFIYNYLDSNIIYTIQHINWTGFRNKKGQFGLSYRTYFMPGSDAKLVYAEKEGLYYEEGDVKVKVLNYSDLFEGDQGRINYFLKDARGILWICMPHGVYKIKISKKHFFSYFTNTQQKLYPWPQARGIYVDLDASGKKTIYANVIASLYIAKENTQQKIDASAWAILGIKNRFYAFGSELHEFDRNTMKCINRINIVDSVGDYSTSVFQFSDSILYVGTSRSIVAYNRFSHEKRVLEKGSSAIPAIKSVYRIVRTSKGVTALADNGIYIIENGKLNEYFGRQTKDKNRYLSIESMLDMCEDENKCLWIATNGEGLVRWEWNKSGANESTVTYRLEDGLPSLILYRMEEDQFNNLWVGTDDGIMKFDKRTGHIALFTVEDGIPHHEFNRTSSFKSEDGWIYFGGMNGVVGFNPEDFNQKKEGPEVPFHIIGITKYSEEGAHALRWNLNDSNQRIICLPSDRLVKIEFAALDYVVGAKMYAYRIDGVQNNDWIYTSESSISVGSLPYGTYAIEIKAQLADGTWLEKKINIPIDFIPPFYLEAWFIVLSLVTIIFLVVGLMRLRNSNLKKRNVKLENLISERTEDLNAALGDKDVLMQELHHRVKNNLQIITGLLELQKEQVSDVQAIAALNEGKMRLESISLIHQNFYTGDDIEFVLFRSFLADLVNAVKQLYGHKDFSIVCILNSEDIKFDINCAIPLGLIVNELVTNTYKYISKDQENKKIEIDLISLDNGSFELIYKDNSAELPEHVNFENSETLGLRLVKGLSKQIGGTLAYRYVQGNIFTIRFTGKSKK